MIGVKAAGRVAVLAAVLAAALPLSGCAALFGGYDVAPNGLPREDDALRRDLARQPEAAYTSVIEGSRELPDDDLLRLLYAGTAGRYAGKNGEGARLLDLAAYVAEDRATARLSREVLSMVTSDRSLPYVPSPTELLMIHYVAAATYLEAGDLDGAVVEARRIEALLDRTGDRDRATSRDRSGVRGASSGPDRRFFHTLAGTIFEAAGEAGAAEVAYRRAGLPEREEEPLDRPAESTGEVVVLVESGYVPHRVEQSVVILLPPWQMEALTEGSAGDKALAATEAAARVLLAASYLYGDRSGYYRDRGYERTIRLEPWRDDDCRGRGENGCGDNGGTPYLLRVSWPVLYQEAGRTSAVRVRAGELGVDAQARFDVAGGARRDFEEDRTAILARTMLRAASKLALSKAAEGALEKRDEAAAQVVGMLTNLGTLLTERADTRSWHLLPAQVSMARLRLPAGRHELKLEMGGGPGGGVDLGEVEVAAGRTTFLTHRIWR